MKKILPIEQWARKDQFHFFKQFEEPFFSLCVELECGQAYRRAKALQSSFFLYYLHKALQAANQVESFRYRIQQDQVWVYDRVHASPTINRPDGTFGFSYIDYFTDFTEFVAAARPEIERVRQSMGLVPANAGENVIHFSALPWIRFTGLSHARSFSFNDSIPKIAFGKMGGEPAHPTMPLSIHVHHALMDGYHVGQFIDCLQQLMNE